MTYSTRHINLCVDAMNGEDVVSNVGMRKKKSWSRQGFVVGGFLNISPNTEKPQGIGSKGFDVSLRFKDY